MFNSTANYIDNSQRKETHVTVKPTCVGTFSRSNNLSSIIKCSLNSDLAKTLLSDKPILEKTVREYDFDRKPHFYERTVREAVVVLQVMVFGDNQCMIEYVKEEDFNKSKEVEE